MSNLLVMRRPEQLAPIPKFAVISTETTTSGQSYYHANIFDGNLDYVGLSTMSSSYGSFDTANFNPPGLPSSNNTNLASAAAFNGWTGNVFWSGSPKMSGTTFIPHGSRYHAYEGTHIDFEGIRGSVFTGCVGTALYLFARGSHAFLETLSLDSATNLGLIPGSSSFTNANWRGVTCYNRRIKTFSLLEPRDTAGSYRYHMWVAPQKDITGRYVGELRDFLQTAVNGSNGASYNYVDITWNTGVSTDVESYANVKVIHGDNGIVGLSRFTPNTGNRYATLNPNTGVVTSLTALTGTTSFGGSNSYTQRWNTTWDNSVIAFYSHYYYYGSGFNGYFINTDDPSKFTYYSLTNTSNGFTVVPDARSSFYITNSTNSDNGVGLPMYRLNDGLNVFNSENTGTQTAVSTTYVDVGYNSTHYPPVILLDNWGD